MIVEAREPSGSLITARHALDQGLDVFAVPGPIDAPTSAGPNRLLCDGAWPVLAADDILEVLAWGETVGRPRARRRKRRAQPAGHPVLAALLHEPATRDELLRRLPISPEQLALDLLELELENRIHEDRDGRLRVR